MTKFTDDQLADLKVVTSCEKPYEEFAVRLSFVKIFKYEMNDMKGKKEYSITGLIPKTATKTLEDIRKAIKNAFLLGVSKGFWSEGKPPAGFKNPLRDGDLAGGVETGGLPQGTEPGDKPEYDNHYFINCSNTRKIVVKDEKNRDIIDNDEYIKSGDYGRLVFTAFPYKNVGKGVSLSLDGVQFLKSGEALGGGNNFNENDFGKVPIGENMEKADTELEDMFK